jgi:ribosomal protein S18 acetylase RimI-like enzyme
VNLRPALGVEEARDEGGHWFGFHPHQEGKVLYEGDLLVGLVSYAPSIRWVGSLWVHPDYRRQGYGSLLLQQYPEAEWIRVAKDNPHALALYRKFGFEIDVTKEWGHSFVMRR